MNTIYNTYKAIEEGFDALIGEVPPTAIMQKYGKEFCVMCGHPTKADKVVLELKSFNRTSALALLESVKESIKGDICNVPPKPKPQKKITEQYVNELILYCGRFNYNKALSDILASLEQAEQQIKQ